MTDTVELEIAMKRAGKKIQNESEFKASEIAALTDFLGLSAKERDAIFFCKET